MKTVVFARRSLQDLDEIFDFHLTRNPRFALELNERLRSAGRSLSDQSERGAPIRSGKRELRRLMESNHVILYATEGTVTILRVLHGSRDLAAILADLT